jgi:sigma54-dependent transcription regulator
MVVVGAYLCMCVYSWVCIANARVFLLLLLPISFFYSQPPSPKGASHDITIHLELGFTRYNMVLSSLQQIIDERISFLKEQINQDNKPEVNRTFQLQIDAIRSVDDLEKIEFVIKDKKALLRNSKDVHESDRLFAELDGLEWLQRQIARYS